MPVKNSSGTKYKKWPEGGLRATRIKPSPGRRTRTPDIRLFISGTLPQTNTVVDLFNYWFIIPSSFWGGEVALVITSLELIASIPGQLASRYKENRSPLVAAAADTLARGHCSKMVQPDVLPSTSTQESPAQPLDLQQMVNPQETDQQVLIDQRKWNAHCFKFF